LKFLCKINNAIVYFKMIKPLYKLKTFIKFFFVLFIFRGNKDYLKGSGFIPNFKYDTEIFQPQYLKSSKLPIFIQEFSLLITLGDKLISDEFDKYVNKIFFQGKLEEKKIIKRKKLQEGISIKLNFHQDPWFLLNFLLNFYLKKKGEINKLSNNFHFLLCRKFNYFFEFFFLKVEKFWSKIMELEDLEFFIYRFLRNNNDL